MIARFQRVEPRAHVLGCEIDRVDMEEALRRCETYIAAHDARHQHMAVNAAKVVASRHDGGLRALINGCDLVTADGQAVVWASRLLGDPLPERVTGIDLMEALLALADRRGYRVYFLGARPDVLARAIARVHGRCPGVIIAGGHDGYFSRGEEPKIASEIRRARPDLLLVAMPTPRKEDFLGRWGEVMEVPLAMGVGGALDVLAGETRRAPRSLQRLGLEWLFRVVQEPRRLWRRYLVSNCAFVWLTARAMLRERPVRGSAR